MNKENGRKQIVLRTCVNEDVFFEIRILIEFLGTEMAAEGADSGMN